MSYRLIGDSCSDLDESQKKNPLISVIPLTLEIGDYSVIDDEKFNQKDFLQRVAASPIGPKSACPSPEAFKKAFDCAEDMVFVVTISEHLSGTYQSAILGEKLYREKYGTDKKILILSSHSASAGQYRLLLELERLCESGLSFEEISKKITKFRDEMKTYFVLETLETLRKNGRLGRVSAFLATALNIKPIMGAVEGVIIKLEQARGIQKALNKMVDLAVAEAGKSAYEKEVCITHVNNPQRGELVAKAFKDSGKFKAVHVTEAMGVATMYACDGGIVLGIG